VDKDKEFLCKEGFSEQYEDYLLRSRIGIFSFFIILGTVVFLLEEQKVFGFLQRSAYLANLFFLSLATYLFLAFIIDRYYEKLFLASLTRECDLKIRIAHPSESVLSDENEPLKNRIDKLLNRQNVFQSPLFVYGFLFAATLCIHLIFLFRSKDILWLFSSLAFYTLSITISFFINRPLSFLQRDIRFYRRIFCSRILFTGKMIEDRLKEVCRDIFTDRINRGTNDPVVLVPIMNGGRPVAERFKEVLEEMAPFIAIEEFPITIKRTEKETLTEPRIKEFRCHEEALKDRFVIIIDDLTDNAETLKLARKRISGLQPKKLITFVVVVKRKPSANGFLPD
jgi:hypoxanthine-guanine phosphoribosyltransferase